MLFKLQPWSGNERLYFYRQSQQLAGQTGQIGKLRADFDRDGNGFFSSWEDIRDPASIFIQKESNHENCAWSVVTFYDEITVRIIV